MIWMCGHTAINCESDNWDTMLVFAFEDASCSPFWKKKKKFNYATTSAILAELALGRRDTFIKL